LYAQLSFKKTSLPLLNRLSRPTFVYVESIDMEPHSTLTAVSSYFVSDSTLILLVTALLFYW